MLKKVRTFKPEAIIKDEQYRHYVESFESELLRGISTLTVLSIINEHSINGIYGYKLLKELEERTNNVLILSEGTLYPLLRKMERDGLLSSEKKVSDEGRERKHYFLTTEGETIFNHLSGFFGKLLEAISSLMEFSIKLPEKEFIYCPNCKNKIRISEDVRFCDICGLYLEDIIQRRR
jgi:PadR family transcriptional regulator PadR